MSGLTGELSILAPMTPLSVFLGTTEKHSDPASQARGGSVFVVSGRQQVTDSADPVIGSFRYSFGRVSNHLVRKTRGLLCSLMGGGPAGTGERRGGTQSQAAEAPNDLSLIVARLELEVHLGYSPEIQNLAYFTKQPSGSRAEERPLLFGTRPHLITVSGNMHLGEGTDILSLMQANSRGLHALL